MNQDLVHPLVSSSTANLLGLLSTFGCDAKYLPRALFLLTMTMLRQPFRWMAAAGYSRRIRRQQIEPPPIFIIGHWRSGTTHLQNLMSRDPQFARVTLLQAAMPHEFLIVPASIKGRLGGMLPPTRLMDNVPVAADVPWEEELALTSVGRLSFYHVSFFPRCMGRIFDEAVLFEDGDTDLIDTWKRQYLHFLRKVQLVQPGRPLLLKNPANTARIVLLKEMFPGSRFVHIHRDPYRVFASSVHLYLKAQEAWGLHSTDRDSVARHILDSYPKLMNAFFVQREGLSDDELVEIGFRSLQEDPLATLGTIYDHLGIEGFDAAVPEFERYIDSQRDYKKNDLPLAAHEQDEVARRWNDVFDRLGYAV
jgi:hypothetical protein